MGFKQNGPKLSKPCVDALIAAGDTSQRAIPRRNMSISRKNFLAAKVSVVGRFAD